MNGATTGGTINITAKARKRIPLTLTTPPAVSGAAGVGSTPPRAAGSPTARATDPATAAAALACALPGPENEPQFSVTLIFGFGKTKTLKFFSKTSH